MEKNQEIAKYKAGIIMVLFFAVISILNCMVLLLYKNGTIVLASIVPQLALSMILQGANVFSAVAMGVFLIVLPIGTYITSYIMSKSNYKWLLPCIMVMGGDIAVLLYYLITSGYIANAIPDLLIEAMVIYSVITAFIKGKKLNNDFSVEQKKVSPKRTNGRKIYEYSKELAKRNKTGRNAEFYVIFGILALALYVLSTVISNNKDFLGETGAFVLSSLLIVTILGIYIYMAIKFAPYTSASTCYFYTENKVVHRADTQIENNDVVLNNLELVAENNREYICTYFDGKKTKKYIIPKCYKDIEEIFK